MTCLAQHILEPAPASHTKQLLCSCRARTQSVCLNLPIIPGSLAGCDDRTLVMVLHAPAITYKVWCDDRARSHPVPCLWAHPLPIPLFQLSPLTLLASDDRTLVMVLHAPAITYKVWCDDRARSHPVPCLWAHPLPIPLFQLSPLTLLASWFFAAKILSAAKWGGFC